MPELQLIARYRIAEGKEDEVVPLLVKLADASRGEPGNREFDGYRRLDDPREVVLLERYTSTDALDAHRDTPHFKDLVLERIMPLLESRVVETYEVADR